MIQLTREKGISDLINYIVKTLQKHSISAKAMEELIDSTPVLYKADVFFPPLIKGMKIGAYELTIGWEIDDQCGNFYTIKYIEMQ